MELLRSPAAPPPPPSHGRQMLGERGESIPESPPWRSRKRLHLPVSIDATITCCRRKERHAAAGTDGLTSTTAKTVGPNLWTSGASSTRRTCLSV